MTKQTTYGAQSAIMRARSIVRPLAILAGVIVVAACGPGGTTTTAAPAGSATTSPGETTTAVGTPPDGLPTFAVPSFTSDADLEALLPDELGGATVAKLSIRGDDYLRDGGESAAEFLAELSQFGWSPADLSVAFASTDDVNLVAFRINGVEANLFFEAFKSRLEDAGGGTTTDVSFGGKSVKKFVPIGGATIYVYLAGDVLFSIGATDKPGISIDDTDELLNEAFSKLP